MEILSFIWGLIKNYGIDVGFIALIILISIKFFLILMDENKTAIWRAKIYKSLMYFSEKREYEKKYVSNDIRGRLNQARVKLNFGKDLLPKAVGIEWVENAEGETYTIKEGEFFVKLDPANCQENNIVTLATAIVERTSLVGIRNLIEKPLQNSIDLNLVKELLDRMGNERIKDWFFSEKYDPEIKNDEKTNEWNTKISEINEKGLFLRILIVELKEFSKKIKGLEPRPYMKGEIEGLIEFLYKYAIRKYEERIPLDYRKAHIGIGFLPVAKTDKILHEGIEKYIKAIAIKMEYEIDTLYMIVFDKEMLAEFSPEAKQRFDEIVNNLETSIKEHPQIFKDFEDKYICVDQFGNRRHAKCIRYRIKYEN